MNTRRLTMDALLTAVALTIFLVELQIPSPTVPGIKLGLANIVTLYAVFALGPGDAAGILLSRVLLSSLFSGQMMALFYSLSGGALCLLAMLALRKILSAKQIWFASVLGAIAHNGGQICAAIALTGTVQILFYLPVLMISGTLAGLFTGLCAQFLLNRLRRLHIIPA